MAFDDSGIVLVLSRSLGSAEVTASWEDTRPDGTWYQVWVNGRLFGVTQNRSIQLPAGGARLLVHVGAVLASEVADLTLAPPSPASLGTGPNVLLTWRGGPSKKIAGYSVATYAIFRGTSAGGPVDYSAPIARVAASTVGMGSGWGRGRWGRGGWGRSERRYEYRDVPPGPGVWQYAIRPLTDAGQAGQDAIVSAHVDAPPRAPDVIAGDQWGRRIRHETVAGVPTLTWGASPDWTPATGEIQTLTITGGPPVSGSVVVSLGGPYSVTIPYNATAATLLSLLDAAIPGGHFVTGGGPWPSTPLTIMFVGDFEQADYRLITQLSSTLSAGSFSAATTTAAVGPGDEVQVLWAQVPATGGWFTLAYGSGPPFSASLNWDATASQVQAALEGLASIGAGNVTCSGGPLPSTPIWIRFGGSLAATNVAAVIIGVVTGWFDGTYLVATLCDGVP